jgi:hypothetical protein
MVACATTYCPSDRAITSGRSGRVGSEQCPPGSGQSFEPGDVEVIVVDVEPVAVPDRFEHRPLASDPLGVERIAEAGHVHPQRVQLAVTVISPQVFEDPTGRQRGVAVHEQECEDGPLFRSAEVDVDAVAMDGDRAECSELHDGQLTSP